MGGSANVLSRFGDIPRGPAIASETHVTAAITGGVGAPGTGGRFCAIEIRTDAKATAGGPGNADDRRYRSGAPTTGIVLASRSAGPGR